MVTLHNGDGSTIVTNVSNGGQLDQLKAKEFDNRVWVGWSTIPINAPVDDEPELVEFPITIQGDLDLYAIYASPNGGYADDEDESTIVTETFESARPKYVNYTIPVSSETMISSPSSIWAYNNGIPTNATNYGSAYSGSFYLSYKVEPQQNQNAYLKAWVNDFVGIRCRVKSSNSTYVRCYLQYSITGQSWIDIEDENGYGSSAGYSEISASIGTPLNVYVRIKLENTHPSNYYWVSIDDICIERKPKNYWFSDYSGLADVSGLKTMAYDGNGGTGAPDAIIEMEGWKTIPMDEPIRECFTFKGWKVKGMSEYDHLFQPGDRYRLNHDVIMEAQWEPIEGIGEQMDIVQWQEDELTINMNGFNVSQGVEASLDNGQTWMTLVENTRFSANGNVDRTYGIPFEQEAGGCLHLMVRWDSKTGDDYSDHCYRVPYIYHGQSVLMPSNTWIEEDDIVVSEGELIVDESTRVHAVYVYPDAKLTIAEGVELETDVLYMRTMAFHPSYLRNEGTLTTGEMYYTRIMADNQNSYMVGWPMPSAVASMRLSTGQSLIYGTQWLLHTYDGQQRAQSGFTNSNWKTETELVTMEACRGYLLSSNSAYYREFLFPVVYNSTMEEEPLVAYSGTAAEDNPVHKGWNLICACGTDVTPIEPRLVSLLNEDKITYLQTELTELPPLTPYFYQYAGNELAPVRVAADEKRYTLVLTDSAGRSDEAHFRLSTDYAPTYEIGRDLWKKVGFGNRPQVWSMVGNTDYCYLATIPSDTISIGYYASEAMVMQLELNQEPTVGTSSVWLIDEEMNRQIDLTTQAYQFTTQAGENRTRIKIILTQPSVVPSDNEEVEEDWVIEKKVCDQRLVIRHGTQWFDIMGRRYEIR